LKLPKQAANAIQAALGITLSAPWAVPALAAPANTETQTQTTPSLHEGDLVRLRSGGPEMTVKSVQGKWVVATWWNEGYGGFQSSGFPLAMVDGPITLPPVDVSPPTSPTEPSNRPPGDLSSAGQPNQNPTAQATNQTRQVRPANADTSTSPSTRPARILLSQQGTGQLQQGTRTNRTIGVAQLRPVLALPLQRGAVLNQTVNIPLQQGTGTNQTIGVPQVRPMLVLPQGTVQQALPLPLPLSLQQGTGGIGQVRPANAGTSMRPQGVIGKRF
jgi:uncharacterized protein YodC (DUF2158 family)